MPYNLPMKLIIGLGNPGKEYENTRHNIGFKVIDALCSHFKVDLNKKKYHGTFYKGQDFILAKPMTFMNRSGQFVQPMAKYFKVKPEDILIIYDDMDLSIAEIRFRKTGSSGGQNGIKDILFQMGTNDIPRLKIGIGRPNNKAEKHVLGPFSKIQLEKLNQVKDKIINRVLEFIKS